MPRKTARKPSLSRSRLRAELSRLLREDPQARAEIVGILSEYLTSREETAAILSELRQMRADFDRRLEEHSRRLEEHSQRLEEHGRLLVELGLRIEEQGRRIEELSSRIEEHSRRIEEHSRRIEEHSRRIEELALRMSSFERTLGAIGARWGMMTEEAFRQAVRALFSEQPEVQVERWHGYDESGRVFGYPSELELDAVVRDGVHVLVEIKSSVSAGDVVAFSRKTEVYVEKTGRAPARKLMVSPFVDPRARAVAERLGIELCASSTPPEL